MMFPVTTQIKDIGVVLYGAVQFFHRVGQCFGYMINRGFFNRVYLVYFRLNMGILLIWGYDI